MTPDERHTHAARTMDKCEFIIRKELTFSAFAIIAFAVTYDKASPIPYLVDIVIYSFLASGAFSIVLVHLWKRKQLLFFYRTDIDEETPKEKTTLKYIRLLTYLYKSLYVIGVASAVTLYATSS